MRSRGMREYTRMNSKCSEWELSRRHTYKEVRNRHGEQATVEGDDVCTPGENGEGERKRLHLIVECITSTTCNGPKNWSWWWLFVQHYNLSHQGHREPYRHGGKNFREPSAIKNSMHVTKSLFFIEEKKNLKYILWFEFN